MATGRTDRSFMTNCLFRGGCTYDASPAVQEPTTCCSNLQAKAKQILAVNDNSVSLACDRVIGPVTRRRSSTGDIAANGVVDRYSPSRRSNRRASPWRALSLTCAGDAVLLPIRHLVQRNGQPEYATAPARLHNSALRSNYVNVPSVRLSANLVTIRECRSKGVRYLLSRRSLQSRLT